MKRDITAELTEVKSCRKIMTCQLELPNKYIRTSANKLDNIKEMKNFLKYTNYLN